MVRIVLASLAAALALALVPAAAPAQDPGSTQYQDPLAGDTGPPPSDDTPSGNGTGQPSGSTTPSTQTAGTQETATTPARDELPRTGFDAWLLLQAGGALLAGGLVLRRTAGRAVR